MLIAWLGSVNFALCVTQAHRRVSELLGCLGQRQTTIDLEGSLIYDNGGGFLRLNRNAERDDVFIPVEP